MTQYINESLTTEKIQEKLQEITSYHGESSLINKTDMNVMEALLQIQPATRMDICELTGIPRTTIYDSLTRLILKKIVTKYSVSNNSKGRPKVYYRVV